MRGMIIGLFGISGSGKTHINNEIKYLSSNNKQGISAVALPVLVGFD